MLGNYINLKNSKFKLMRRSGAFLPGLVLGDFLITIFRQAPWTWALNDIVKKHFAKAANNIYYITPFHNL